jgi:hypothetical protein
MKKYLSFGRSMILAAMLLTVATTVNAQDAETTMQDIYEQGLGMVKYLEEEANQEIVRIEYDLVFDSKETIRNLSSSYTYTVVAFADDRVEDLDITIYKKSGSSWTQVTKDTETDNTPVVQITPKEAGEYKVKITAYKFAEGYSGAHYGMIISHENP